MKKENNNCYTLKQQAQLDELLIKYHYDRNFRPERMESRLQDIKEWKELNGYKESAFNCKQNTIYL